MTSNVLINNEQFIVYYYYMFVLCIVSLFDDQQLFPLFMYTLLVIAHFGPSEPFIGKKYLVLALYLYYDLIQ